jgi:hypothetical protein
MSSSLTNEEAHILKALLPAASAPQHAVRFPLSTSSLTHCRMVDVPCMQSGRDMAQGKASKQVTALTKTHGHGEMRSGKDGSSGYMLALFIGQTCWRFEVEADTLL